MGCAAALPVMAAFTDNGDISTEALSFIDGLYGAALRLTRNAADAQDLVQDTYLKAFRAADRFQQAE